MLTNRRITFGACAILLGTVLKRRARTLIDCWVCSGGCEFAVTCTPRQRDKTDWDVKEELLVGVRLQPLVATALEEITNSVRGVLV